MKSARPFQNRLVVFAKAPRLGTVKSRLAKDLGLVNAVQLYRRLLDRTLRALSRDLRWQSILALTPDTDAYQGFRFPYPNIAFAKQGPGDLGDRMGRFMAKLPPGPVVIVGTDIPNITTAHIDQAFSALGDHDAAFGPAGDGGYWLIGLKRRPRSVDIFRDVRWSTEHALADTEKNLRIAIPNAKIKMLDQLDDIDDIASYTKLKDKLI